MDKRSIIRTVVLLIALANQALTSAGKSPLPIDDETVGQVFSFCFTAATTLWAWWKNNYISKTGLAQKGVLQDKGLYKQ